MKFNVVNTLVAIVLLFIYEAPAQSPSDNTLSRAEKKEGWELLFNGKTLKGWRGIGLPGAPDGWIVENGAIKILPKTDWPRQADGQPIRGADLITKKRFKNFELEWDWKIGPNGNSGLKYNVSEKLSIQYPPKGCALGFEYQMADDAFTTGRSLKNSTGAMYDIVPSDEDKLLSSVGEFNTSRIVFKGTHVEHWLNGKKVLEYDIDCSSFGSLIQASKFKTIPGFADKKKGHIVLQDHAEEAWFKNIKIRKLNKPRFVIRN